MASDSSPLALRYKIDRLDELIERGNSLLEGIGKYGNIDQHDLWYTAAHSFLAINSPVHVSQLNSIAKKYRDELLAEYPNRATHRLIQEQTEVMRLVRGYFDELLQSSPEPNAIFAAIEDKELRDRCSDLLAATNNFDRAVNQASLVLEDRIRRKAGLNGLQGIALINKALNSRLDESILKLSDDPQTHEGVCQICRGIVLAYRNPTHHRVIEKYPRADALKFCAFVDSLLSLIDHATL